MRRADARDRNRQHRGRVRLIGGEWRGRWLEVIDAPGLRPTGDRVRETLFNWLQTEVAGRRCLDLFAGTGALAFEALSRGAARATLVEPAKAVYRELSAAAERLGAADRVALINAAATDFLGGSCAGRGNSVSSQCTYDLVFIDPPFAEIEHLDVLFRLAPRLAVPAVIYLELPTSRSELIEVPDHWRQRRTQRFGDIIACLYDTRCV